MVKVSKSFAVTSSLVVFFGGTGALGYGTLINRSLSVSASPSVFATIATTGTGREPRADDRLALLVLWRGTPGWRFRAASGHYAESGGGNQAGEFYFSIDYGSMALNMSWDVTAHRATLQGKPIPFVPGTNVLLIDEVDSPTGPKFAKALSIDPGDANLNPFVGSLGSLLRRSSEIVSFLRCGVGETTEAINQVACADLTK